jgi:Ca2+-binding EF-hand superfamily protein
LVSFLVQPARAHLCVISLADTGRSGSIDFEHFLQAMAGRMNKQRRDIVDMAYNVLDADGSGEVDMADMINIYNVTSHPDYKAGKKTKEQILRELIDVFDVGEEKDGRVTKQEFRNYYQQISAAIENDNMFELMIRNAWHISGGAGQAANTANRRVLVTRSDGSQAVEEVKGDLGLAARDREGTLARLKMQGVNAANIDFAGGTEDKNQRFRPNSAAPFVRRPSSASATSRNPYRQQNAQAQAKQEIIEGQMMAALVDDVRSQLIGDDANGVIELQRQFREVDTNGSGSLDLQEFTNAIRNCRILVNTDQVRRIFNYFGETGLPGAYTKFITYSLTLTLVSVSVRYRSLR